MPGAEGATRRAALMRRLRRLEIAPRLTAVAALVLIAAAASTTAGVVAAAPSSTVAAHQAGGPVGPELPPPGPAPEAPADAAPPGALPTVDGVVPPDGTVPADAGTGLGDTSSGTGDLGTTDPGVTTGGSGLGDLSGGVTSGGSLPTGGSVATPPSVGGQRVTTPPPAAPTPAQVCTSRLTPAYIADTFHVVSNDPLAAPDAVDTRRTTCTVTSGAAPDPATVLTAVVTDQYTQQDQQRALSALRDGRQLPRSDVVVTPDGHRHVVWFQPKPQQQGRMVELDVPPRTPATIEAIDGTTRLFAL